MLGRPAEAEGREIGDPRADKRFAPSTEAAGAGAAPQTHRRGVFKTMRGPPIWVSSRISRFLRFAALNSSTFAPLPKLRCGAKGSGYDTWWRRNSMTWRLALLLMFATPSWACMCSGNWPRSSRPGNRHPLFFWERSKLQTQAVFFMCRYSPRSEPKRRATTERCSVNPVRGSTSLRFQPLKAAAG